MPDMSTQEVRVLLRTLDFAAVSYLPPASQRGRMRPLCLAA